MCIENQSTTSEENTSFTPQTIPRPHKSSHSEQYSKKWTVPENILYARYLKTHMSQMTNKKKKKCGKFIKMSNFIGSKTQNQCRSHHQKMMLTFHSIQNIIKYAAELKKRGEPVHPEDFQKENGIVSDGSQLKQKREEMEEQKGKENSNNELTQIEKQDEIRNENICEGDFPISIEESKELQIYCGGEDIFDVLSIDAAEKYSEYFSF